ncbi:hypothetical protein [Limosilactobacillus reuteri]|nr:hypothetical protein [Limosilactobacillus reuteri]WLR79364.1 hypothetical protein Q3A95_09290 [Limosilactobacillus reuteri]
MKLLTTIDKHILSYWDTAPSERLWAYLACCTRSNEFNRSVNQVKE